MVKGRLVEYRRRIDQLDRKIVRLLRKRYNLVRLVGRQKQSENIPIEQPEREEEILKKIQYGAMDRGFREFIDTVYRSVFKASRKIEEE